MSFEMKGDSNGSEKDSDTANRQLNVGKNSSQTPKSALGVITKLLKSQDSMSGKDLSKHLAKALNDENLSEIGDEPVLDSNHDEKEVLRRYHDIYRRFRKVGLFPLIEKPFTERSIVDNELLDTIVDFSVNYAIQGQGYVDENQMNLQYVVLQAALILTITYTYYIEPGLSDKTLNHAFSFVMGLSAMLHIATIVMATITTGAFNMCYTELDTAVFKVTMDFGHGLQTIINILNYVAVIAAIVGMFIAGFDRSNLDGYLQLYGIAVILGLLVFFVKMLFKGGEIQNYRAYLFYKKYCEIDGQLKQKYLDTLYQDDEEEDTKQLLKRLLIALDKDKAE